MGKAEVIVSGKVSVGQEWFNGNGEKVPDVCGRILSGHADEDLRSQVTPSTPMRDIYD